MLFYSVDMLSIEKLITEVGKQPCIWNTKHKNYVDKESKLKAWEKICQSFYPQWEQYPQEETKQLIACLQKKWKSIRDYYTKQRKGMLSGSSNSSMPGVKRRKYIYSDLLHFLDKTPDHKGAKTSTDCGEESEIEDETSDEVTQNEDSQDTMKEALIKMEEFEYSDEMVEVNHSQQISMDKTIDRRQDIDEDEMFLMSLLPSIRKLTPLQKMDFKLEVMTSLKRIQFSK